MSYKSINNNMKSKKEATKENPHNWFFGYMNKFGDSDEERNEIRRIVVYEYSNGKTQSLADLYKRFPKLYFKMKEKITTKCEVNKDPLHMPRRRLMAAIYELLENQQKEKPADQQKTISKEYVKKVACVAARVDRFNDIPLTALTHLYRSIGEKNFKQLDKAVDELVANALKN